MRISLITSVEFILVILFATACGPSAESIATQTAFTWTRTPTITFTPSPSNTSTMTPTPTNTATVTPTMTPSPTATVTATPLVGKIPGLTPVDVKLNLENQGFDCELIYAAIPTDPYYKWECKKDSFSNSMLVEIWSTSIMTVDLVRASIVQYDSPSNSLAIDFLGFVATLPYDGSQPQQARAWVETTLPTITRAGDIRITNIGGIKFQLYGIPSARSLTIGEDLPSP